MTKLEPFLVKCLTPKCTDLYSRFGGAPGSVVIELFFGRQNCFAQGIAFRRDLVYNIA